MKSRIVKILINVIVVTLLWVFIAFLSPISLTYTFGEPLFYDGHIRLNIWIYICLGGLAALFLSVPHFIDD